MARRQIFEFEDFHWFPRSWRNYMTDYLHFQQTWFDAFRPIVPTLSAALARSGTTHLVDLCSGGSGPVARVQALLRASGIAATATLCDKFPNLEAFQRVRAEHPGVDFVAEPVDATDVPADLVGFRTLFCSFHHFSPELARRILQDAVSKGESIGVFEITSREPMAFVGILGVPAMLLALTPLFRPFSWSRLFWTYVVPAVPALTLWDGMASNFRTYDPDELRALVAELDGADDYDWDIGRARSTVPMMPITYLVGTPRRTSSPETTTADRESSAGRVSD